MFEDLIQKHFKMAGASGKKTPVRAFLGMFWSKEEVPVTQAWFVHAKGWITLSHTAHVGACVPRGYPEKENKPYCTEFCTAIRK